MSWLDRGSRILTHLQRSPRKNLAGAFLVHQSDAESARAAFVYQTMAGAAVVNLPDQGGRTR